MMFFLFDITLFYNIIMGVLTFLVIVIFIYYAKIAPILVNLKVNKVTKQYVKENIDPKILILDKSTTELIQKLESVIERKLDIFSKNNNLIDKPINLRILAGKIREILERKGNQ